MYYEIKRMLDMLCSGYNSVAQCLPGLCEILSSIPMTTDDQIDD